MTMGCDRQEHTSREQGGLGGCERHARDSGHGYGLVTCFIRDTIAFSADALIYTLKDKLNITSRICGSDRPVGWAIHIYKEG